MMAMGGMHDIQENTSGLLTEPAQYNGQYLDVECYRASQPQHQHIKNLPAEKYV